jgi:hypothetical protein
LAGWISRWPSGERAEAGKRLDTHEGVETYVEPKTVVSPKSVVLIDGCEDARGGVGEAR